MEFKLVPPKAKIILPMAPHALYFIIEYAGRTCYRSTDKMTTEPFDEARAAFFIQSCIRRGHDSVLEHGNITVEIVCDRAVSHQLVRHRLAAYSQESQRYCRYDGEISFVEPEWVHGEDEEDDRSLEYQLWFDACREAAEAYEAFLDWGRRPEQARSVLPNSTATKIIVTMNVRQWRHVLKQRLHKASDPDMRRVMRLVARELVKTYPVLFLDIAAENGVQTDD